MKVGIYKINETLYIQKDKGEKPFLFDTSFSDSDPENQGIIELDEKVAEKIVEEKKITIEMFLKLLKEKIKNMKNYQEFYAIEDIEDFAKRLIEWINSIQQVIKC